MVPLLKAAGYAAADVISAGDFIPTRTTPFLVTFMLLAERSSQRFSLPCRNLRLSSIKGVP